MSIGELAKLYGDEYDFAVHAAASSKRYVIATTPRSGSTLFALMLWQTGRLGAPLEYLNLPCRLPLAERLGATSLRDYLDRLIRVRTSPNGVFATKAFYLHASHLRAHHETIEAMLAPTAFILLKRRDEAAQTVSLSKAVQSRAWTGSAASRQVPQYHFGHLFKCHTYLRWQEAGWKALIASAGVPSLEIIYEDLLDRPDRSVEAVETFIGVGGDPRAGVTIPLPKRQGDIDRDPWKDRFLRDLESGMADVIDVAALTARFPSYGGDWTSPLNEGRLATSSS